MVSSACFPSSAILWSHRQQFFGQIAHCAVATRWQAEAPSSSPFNLQSNNTNCGWRYEVENGALGDGRLRWWMCLRVPVLCSLLPQSILYDDLSTWFVQKYPGAGQTDKPRQPSNNSLCQVHRRNAHKMYPHPLLYDVKDCKNGICGAIIRSPDL